MAAFLFPPPVVGVRTPAVPALGRAAGTFGGVQVGSAPTAAASTDAAARPAPAVALATPVPPAAPVTRRALLRTASAAAAAAAVVATGVAGRRPGTPSADVSPPLTADPAGLPATPVPLWVRTAAPAAVAPAAADAGPPPLPLLVFTDAATPAGYTATHEAATAAGRGVTSIAAAAPASSSPTAVAAAVAAADVGRGGVPGRVHVVGGGGAAARAAVAYAAAAGRAGVASLTLEAPRLGADAPPDAAWAAVLADVYRPAGAAAAAAGVPRGAGGDGDGGDDGGWAVATPAAAAGTAAAAAVAVAVPGGDYRSALAGLTAAGLPVAVVRSAADDADVTVWMTNVPALGEAARPRAGPWACVGAAAAGGGTRTEAWGGWHSAAATERAAFVAALGGMYDRIERA